MVTNVVTAAFLNPNELGSIQSILLILPYLAFMHLGVFNGLNRNLAFYRAQKNHEKVQDFVDASFTMASFASLAGSLIAVCYLCYYLFIHPSKIYFLASLLLFLNLALNPFITHFETTYRSGQNFKVLGKITLTENTVYAFVNLLPIWIGYVGKIIANGLRVVMRFGLRIFSQPYKARAIGKKEDIVELSKVGMPLMIGGYLQGVILVSDQTMVARYLGTESLGMYSLSVFLMTGIAVIPTTVNTLLYPKASAFYGKVKSNAGLRRFFWSSLYVNMLILFPICLILYFSIEPLTLYFLPKYASGIMAAKINLLTALTFVSNGPSIVIGVVRKNKPMLFMYVLSIALVWLFSLTIDRGSMGIELFAWMRFFISLFISAFTLCYSYYLTGTKDYTT